MSAVRQDHGVCQRRFRKAQATSGTRLQFPDRSVAAGDWRGLQRLPGGKVSGDRAMGILNLKSQRTPRNAAKGAGGPYQTGVRTKKGKEARTFQSRTPRQPSPRTAKPRDGY